MDARLRHGMGRVGHLHRGAQPGAPLPGAGRRGWRRGGLGLPGAPAGDTARTARASRRLDRRRRSVPPGAVVNRPRAPSPGGAHLDPAHRDRRGHRGGGAVGRPHGQDRTRRRRAGMRRRPLLRSRGSGDQRRGERERPALHPAPRRLHGSRVRHPSAGVPAGPGTGNGGALRSGEQHDPDCGRPALVPRGACRAAWPGRHVWRALLQ